MSMTKRRSADEFDRAVCFTCFAPWVEAIKDLANVDPQTAIDAFIILADYCLYGVEPEPEGNPWGFVWPIIASEAGRSINNRRRGFGAEDTELSDAIRAYHAEHPEDSQRAIADAVGCSVGKVNKVLKASAADSPPVTPLHDGSVHSNVHSYISNEHDIHSLPSVNGGEVEIFGNPLPASDGRKGADL